MEVVRGEVVMGGGSEGWRCMVRGGGSEGWRCMVRGGGAW